MNNTFDWNRFCKLVGKDFRNLWPLCGPTLLVLTLLPLAWWLVCVVSGIDTGVGPSWRLLMICGTAAMAAILVPSRLYRTMNLRGEGIYYAMLPASKLEKYLSMLLYSLIVCPLMVYVGGLVVDLLLTILPFGPYNEWVSRSELGFPFPFMLSRWDAAANSANFPDGWFAVTMWTGYLASTSIFIFTATLFRRHKVLFTILWLYLIQFVLSLVAIPVGIGAVNSEGFTQWLYDTFNGWTEQQAVNIMFGSLVAFHLVVSGVLLWLTRRRLIRMPY